MGEEIKTKILEFLKSHSGEDYSVRSLVLKSKIASYHTTLKWVMVLGAEEDSGVEVKNYGNIKIVKYVGDGN